MVWKIIMGQPTSTTTLLEAVNRVLLDVGERRVTTFTSPAALKAVDYLQDSYVDMQNFHDWEWLKTEFQATSWSAEQATFTDLRRIKYVRYQNETDEGIRWIPYCDQTVFDRLALEAFDSSTATSTRPLRYSIFDHEVIRVNPYPTDTAGQNKLTVIGWKYFAPPTTTTGTFTIPERFMGVLIKRAVYQMYMRHLGDFNAAQAVGNEFYEQLALYRAKETGVSTQGTNMYRSYRR